MQDGAGINVSTGKINFVWIVYIFRTHKERWPNRSFWYKNFKNLCQNQ